MLVASLDIILSKISNYKDADQSLFCTFVVRKQGKTGFLVSRPIYCITMSYLATEGLFTLC